MNISIQERRERILEKKPIPVHPNHPIIIGYIRVSSQKQIDEGHSVEGQGQILKDYINNHKNLTAGLLLTFVDEAKSGKSIVGRDEFNKMRSYMKPGDSIITWNLSRLGRNTKEMIDFVSELRDKNIGLIITDLDFDTTTPIGKVLLTLLIAVSEFERDQVSERTKAIMQTRKEQGFVVTRPPFGMRVGDNKKLEEEPAEQKVIDLIVEMVDEDPMIKDAEITRRLQELFDAGEITMRDATKVHHTTVRSIIKRYNIRNESVQK